MAAAMLDGPQKGDNVGFMIISVIFTLEKSLGTPSHKNVSILYVMKYT